MSTKASTKGDQIGASVLHRGSVSKGLLPPVPIYLIISRHWNVSRRRRPSTSLDLSVPTDDGPTRCVHVPSVEVSRRCDGGAVVDLLLVFHPSDNPCFGRALNLLARFPTGVACDDLGGGEQPSRREGGIRVSTSAASRGGVQVFVAVINVASPGSEGRTFAALASCEASALLSLRSDRMIGQEQTAQPRRDPSIKKTFLKAPSLAS